MQSVGTEQPGDLSRQQLDALHPVELAAELIVIDDLRQLRDAFFQPLLAVLVEKKACILQPRPHHALIAGDDMARVGDFHVGDDKKFRKKLPARVEEREVLLVLPHGEDQAFLRDVEEGAVEFADVDAGVLDQRRHLVEQVAVFTERPILLGGSLLQEVVDGCFAAVQAGNDAVRGHRLLIFVGAHEDDVALVHEAMPARSVPRLQPEYLAWHDLLAVEHDKAVHGTHELLVADAPAHHLRDWQHAQRRLDLAGEHVDERFARDAHVRDVDLAFRTFRLLQ